MNSERATWVSGESTQSCSSVPSGGGNFVPLVVSWTRPVDDGRRHHAFVFETSQLWVDLAVVGRPHIPNWGPHQLSQVVAGSGLRSERAQDNSTPGCSSTQHMTRIDLRS